MIRKRLVLFLLVCSVFLFPVVSFAAEYAPVGMQDKSYDLVVIISSILTFMFDCMFRVLNFVDHSLVKIATGNFDVPILGSLHRTLQQAGALEYQIDAPINDRIIVSSICEVSLKVSNVVRNVCIIAEDNIKNGYFPGLLRTFFADANTELQQYEFYQAFQHFVDILPSTKITDSLVAFSHEYLRGHF